MSNAELRSLDSVAKDLSTGLASESLADTGLMSRDSWARISVIFLNLSRNFEGRCIIRWVSKSLSIK